MRFTTFRGILIAITAASAACSSSDSIAPMSPSASSHRTVSADVAGGAKVSRLIDQNVWVSCANGGAGETVHVTGNLRYDVQSTQDSSGVYHFSIKSNTSNLTAVGLTSGTVFRGLMTERVNSRAEDYLNMDLRTADIIRFTAIGSRDAYSLMVSTTMIVDQGTYVVFEQNWNEVCR
jgi:hypothetical protein